MPVLSGGDRGLKRTAFAVALALGLLLVPSPAMSQVPGSRFAVIGANIQERVNGLIALMQYTFKVVQPIVKHPEKPHPQPEAPK